MLHSYSTSNDLEQLPADEMSEFSEAAAYESKSSEQIRLGLNLIRRINPKKGGKVLDLGCGTGRLTQVFADYVGQEGQVVGIDPDTERLKIAREKHSAPNIVYLEADAEHLPGEDYDLIFSNFVLHWVKNKEAVFQQAQNILKHGGLLAICGPIETDKYFPPGENMISKEFIEDTLKNMFAIDIEDIDCYVTKYGFETDYFGKDVAHFDCESAEGIIQCYMTHSPNKLYDISHFNLENIKEHFGDQFIISARVVLAIYRML